MMNTPPSLKGPACSTAIFVRMILLRLVGIALTYRVKRKVKGVCLTDPPLGPEPTAKIGKTGITFRISMVIYLP